MWIRGGRSIVVLLVVLTITLGVGFLYMVIFFRRARITIDSQKLSYRGLFFTRSIELRNIDATFLALSIGLATVNRSRAVLIITNKEGKKFKRLSEGFWSTKDLTDLAEMIDAQTVDISSRQGRDIALNAGPRIQWIMRHRSLFVLIVLGGSFVFVALIVLIANLVKYSG